MYGATDHAILKPHGPEGPEGVMGALGYHFYHPDIKANREFVRAYKDAHGEYKHPGFPTFHGYVTGHFIARAYEKAGVVDREKFIDALEGLTIQSPVGEIEIRVCDHQTVFPIFVGVTRNLQAFSGFVVSADIVTLSGDKVMPSCEEISKARSK
jgi:branched-chain amino acid transport system substrate-binding protein